MDVIRQRKVELVKELKNSDSPVRSNFSIPNSYRKWVWGSKKIIRFWARVQRDRIYSPALIASLRRLSGIWVLIGKREYTGVESSGTLSDRVSNNVELLKCLTDIRDFDIEVIYPNQNVELREVRVRSDSDCSLCGCQLVWPAYIVAVSSTGRKNRISKEFGVKCLNSHIVRLDRFISDVIRKYPIEPTPTKVLKKDQKSADQLCAV